MGLEATRINKELMKGPEIKNSLKIHGVPDNIVAACKFTAGPKGVIVEFPRDGPGSVQKKRNKKTKIPPFSKPTVGEREQAGVFVKVNEELVKTTKNILDNKRN